ncbi:MAG TPA: argininosuccinate lyase [Gammaproteobacteria bacterium]|nr:argininosuccinate lyase [Gammaproteobacteria bacterium]
MSRMWDKGDPLDTRVLQYTAGEDHQLDNRLVAYDVRATIAHARMLAAGELLDAAHLEAIESGLTEIAESHARGDWQISLEEEDVHNALEHRLSLQAPQAAARMHLGRSRNDQVLAALRLYLKDTARKLHDGAQRVAAELEALGEREADTPLPGYTHLQPAMPSSVTLWATGFAAELRDDAEGLLAAARRADRNPLGSAAGYGAPGLPLDREHTRRGLDFATVHEPVTAVQLSRGKAEAQMVFEIHLLMQDLGRLAADLILFCSQEFSYVALPSSMTTGSSIMPQKRNPDVFELVRARAATTLGCLNEALAVPAKLTSGYHRDLQLLKPPLFRAIDLAEATLDIIAHALPEVDFMPDNIRMEEQLYATQDAYKLVTEEGLSFRDAYRQVGQKLNALRSSAASAKKPSAQPPGDTGKKEG